MKTREKNVTVEITDNGHPRQISYPIADDCGNLMTHRLERLVCGKLGHSDCEIDHGIHFVGMVWKRPYTILRELMEDRVLLQAELRKMDSQHDLVSVALMMVPNKAPHGKITGMIQDELLLRKAIKSSIAQLKAAKAK